MPDVKCPKCGSSMVLRIARRGQNAGEKFYGCSQFPHCKEIIPFESVEPAQKSAEKEELSTTGNIFSHTLIARTRFQDFQVHFFEAVAVTEDLLESIESEDIDEETLKAFCQWRVDFPMREAAFILEEKQRQIISVLEKILTRGRLTMTSPKLEKEFKEMFKSSVTTLPLEYLVCEYNKTQKKLWLDSEEENIFYEVILPKILGKNFEQFVIPQVEISSLLTSNVNIDNTQYRRVDFAIFHPQLKEKIIVEIDGKQHKEHIESDKKRDAILQECGYTVIRIPANEIHNRDGEQISVLASKLSIITKRHNDIHYPDNETIKLINSFKLAHQIQIVLLQAIQSGIVDISGNRRLSIVSDLDELGIYDKNEALEITKKSAEDFIELLTKISKLYDVKINIENPTCELVSGYKTIEYENAIFISFSHKGVINLPTFYVQNIYFPNHIANTSFPSSPVVSGLKQPDEKDLEYFLQYLFRKSNFWEGQYIGITRILQGKDALLLLPTGAGKSLVYQLASLLLPGRTLVIDPLISLMEDQIANLAMIGIDRCIAITSQMVDSQDRNRALQLFGQGEYLFIYVAPERFQTIEFRESLRALTVHTPISLIVVDEAHCISEWGHDFRTAYLNIGRTSRTFCESNGHISPLIALTGTASRAVLKDIQRELQIEDFDAIITPKTFDRPELKYHVIYANSQEKTARLKGYIGQMLPGLFQTTSATLYQARGKKTYAGLVFCQHVGGEFGVESISEEIKKGLNISTAIYSGKEPKRWNPSLYRFHKRHVTREFKRDKIPLLVCTKAFGMGIDKPNIRYTVHLGVPPSIESFYQEAGRAGRDRKTAHCCIIVSNDDPERTKKLLNPNTKIEEITNTIKNTSWEENDDITRVLYFHTSSFRGIEKEMQDIKEVLKSIKNLAKRGVETICIPERFKKNNNEYRQAREVTEKALHRILIIGVITDYTINYSAEEFTIKLSGASKEEIIEAYGRYVSSYLYSRKQIEVEKASNFLSLPYLDFVMEVINLLLHFVYEVIERGRRRAFYEMLLACANSPNDKAMRQRILRYLETSEYSEMLDQIINDEKIGIEKCIDLFGVVRSPNDAAELRGQVSRYLESYPDHPGLLMLRSLSEVFSKDHNVEVAKQNFMTSISSAMNNYKVNDLIIFDFAVWAISNIAKCDKELAKELVIELTKLSNRLLNRILIKKLPIELTDIPAWGLLVKFQQDCNLLLTKMRGLK
jgi:ATP-dependent DNA helicase RecQ